MRNLLIPFRLLLIACCVPFFAAAQMTDVKSWNNASGPASPWANRSLIIIGEMHGTDEVPAFVLQMVKNCRKSGKKVKLGLEAGTEYQQDIDHFMQTGDTDLLKRSRLFIGQYDGRGSQAIARLLKGVRETGAVPVFAFDNSEGWTVPDNSSPGYRNGFRDSILANGILSHITDSCLTIILTGNVHAQPNGYMQTEGTATTRPYHTAAWFLKNRLGNRMLTLNTYGNGTAWVCKADSCGVYPVAAPAITGAEAITGDFIYLFEQPQASGFDGFIYFMKWHASPPFCPGS